jgi:hypothetical protein
MQIGLIYQDSTHFLFEELEGSAGGAVLSF